MKLNKQLKVAALSLIYCLSVSAYAFAKGHEQKVDKKDVPQAIISAFTKSYPNAKIHDYSKEVKKGKTSYEIESTDGNTKRNVSYSANGQVLEIEEAISIKDLPQNIVQTLGKSYPKAKIIEAGKEIKGKITKYEVEIKDNNKTKEIVFENGKVKKVKEKENEKNEKNEKGEDNEKGEK